jgi:hypothetical protein
MTVFHNSAPLDIATVDRLCGGLPIAVLVVKDAGSACRSQPSVF